MSHPAHVVAAITAGLALFIGLDASLGGSPTDRAGAPYVFVPSLGVLVLALLVRLQPRSMSLVMVAAALAQIGAMLAMLARGIGHPALVFIIHVLLIIGWGAAAVVYRKG